MAKIFGKYRNGRRLPYEEILKGCPDVEIFNKCTVVVKNERHNVCRRYRLKRGTLEKIFSDEKLLGKILDAKSDFYTKRQRKLIFGAVLGAEREEPEEINEKPEINEETKEAMNEKIQIPEDDLPAMDETGRLRDEIDGLKLEIRRLKSENAALREKARANRPLFDDEAHLDAQEKALGKLLDESWDDLLAERESGKKSEPAPAPKPVRKPEPKSGAEDIPATPPQKSKLYGRLQEFVSKRYISVAEAERISGIAYKAQGLYKEAPGGFCREFAVKNADARMKIANAALAENPYLLGECDEKSRKFVVEMRFMARAAWYGIRA